MKAERSTPCGHGFSEAERERVGEREMMKIKELYKSVVSVPCLWSPICHHRNGSSALEVLGYYKFYYIIDQNNKLNIY